LTVTGAISRIIGRGGWATGNDIRFGSTAYSGSARGSFYDYPDSKDASLVINYTAAGGAPTINLVMAPYTPTGRL